MKVHLTWLRATAAAAIAAAGVGSHPAVAQYVPTTAVTQQPTYHYPATGYQAVPTAGIVPPGRAAQPPMTRPLMTQPTATQQVTQQPATTPMYRQVAAPTYQQTAAPGYQQSALPTYPQVAMQPAGYPQQVQPQASAYQPSQGYTAQGYATQGYTTAQTHPAAQEYAAAGPQGYQATQPTYAPYRPQLESPYGTVSQYPGAAQASAYPAYVALGKDKKKSGDNQGNNNNRDAQSSPDEALPPPADSALPTPPYVEGAPAPGDSGLNGYPGTPAYNGHQNGYVTGAAGYGAANCAPGCETPNYGISHYFDNPGYDSQWFGGVYFLYMERDNPGYSRFTSEVDTGSISYPYYPQARTTVLSTDDVDYDFAPGVEVRLGSTFSIGDSCDGGYGGYGGYGTGHGAGCGTGACGAGSCGSCAPADVYAWEFVWWGLDEDDQSEMVRNFFPDGPLRLYGMRTHAGLMYDSANGARPVNDYYDYQMPIEDDMPPAVNDVRVLRQRVRTYFSAQNLELNFLRFPVCNVGCGGGGCGYDACGYDACGGCEPCACEPAPCFSMTGLCGVRYFRTDDDFEWANQWATYDGGGFMPSTDELFHEIQVDNNLVGFQLGSSMNYAVGCKWNFFLDSSFGLFNNHITQYQRVYGANGNYAFYEETGEGMNMRSSKDDVAMLGELRLGGAYNISCNWRAVLAYRAVGITGLAVATDQLHDEYSNWADTARIDSSGSMILHGVQVGAECKY